MQQFKSWIMSIIKIVLWLLLGTIAQFPTQKKIGTDISDCAHIDVIQTQPKIIVALKSTIKLLVNTHGAIHNINYGEIHLTKTCQAIDWQL